ncbi:hypothetical protein CSC67_01090 [Pusillimonas caeni]|uniref:hypothetical protein n=1 Tax=Pusillimonas caeni TaxID=1348472 RepID=UPI000E59CDF4|nr:hypothetical protein [Pusillimonas caeni]TFL15357.1 hypothetical protein CSC67_01090 [Pusillimonas caeni]
MTLLARINKLKNTVLQAQDLNKAWIEFFDLTAHPDFMKQAGPSRLENLGVILEQIGKSMAPNESGKLRAAPIVRCNGTDFYHGALDIDGKPGAFIYFDDVGVGMAALVTYGTKTELCRFTATVVHSPHCFVPATTQQPAVH